MKQLLIIAITLLLPQITVAANLVQNGSFEDPIQGPGTWSVQTAIPGWDVGSGGIEIRNNNAGLASDGVNFIELDANSNSDISQTFGTTLAGSMYELAFDYSPRIFQLADTNGVDVFWNNVLLASLTGDGGTDNIWESHKFSVRSIGNDTLRFAASGISDSLGGNIDNVSLNVNEVPLPAALWLMVSALGLLGIVPKRKLA